MNEFEYVNDEGVVIENTNYPQAPGQVGTALIDDNPAAQDYKASQAIKGMPQSETTEKLKLMEKQYELWLEQDASLISFGPGCEYVGVKELVTVVIPYEKESYTWVGFWEAVKQLFRQRGIAASSKVIGEVSATITTSKPEGVRISRDRALEIAADPLRIFRMEIKELALAYAAELNGKQALLQQADVGREHIKTQAKQAEFTKFLQRHFEAELEAGRVRKLDLYEIAQGIMLEFKKQP